MNERIRDRKSIRPLSESAPDIREMGVVAVRFEGLRVCLNKPAAQASGIWFRDNSVEPTRRRLYAAQKLMWTLRTAAAPAAALACSHRCLHQAFSHERCSSVSRIWISIHMMDMCCKECRPFSPGRTVLAEVSSRERHVLLSEH